MNAPLDAKVLEPFHPAVAGWFTDAFSAPTDCQTQAWPAIRSGQHTLIAAPTGSGKTLAAFLAAIDHLVQQGITNGLPNTTQIVYVSPLKALSNDIQRNLEIPLVGIAKQLSRMELPEIPIRTLVRTGDTPAHVRATMRRNPPHIVVTTPETLYILLTSDGGREILRSAHTVIVDEIHAVAANKRGSHLSLSLERLDALTDGPLLRIGLSATQRPIDDIARFLVGQRVDESGGAECVIVDTGHMRAMDLAIDVPPSPLEAVMSNEVWAEVYDRLAELVQIHRTTLIFVNTRRMAERVARHLSERVGTENVTSHHGSLAKEQRLAAEQRLKDGELRALVATASLELGIDIGDIDLVCQLGSTRSIATFLQRTGRSGHGIDGLPKGRLFPLSRDDLIECVALLDATRRAELDRLAIPSQPLDVLAQQIVAMVACEEWTEDTLYEQLRKAYPYRALKPCEFQDTVRMLADGFSTQRGRRSAYVHRDAVNRRLRPRRGARLTALTSGGAIPDSADYEVILEPTGTFIGTLNEDFAIESLPGDIFQLGNMSWKIMRIEKGRVRVEDAQGQPPNIPFWFGEAPGRTDEHSKAVSELRKGVSLRLANGDEPGTSTAPMHHAAKQWLIEELGVAASAAAQIVDYLAASQAALGVMPSQDTVVFERFFDESGGMQLVIHSPFGSRINRAWGLALRKRFCRTFNFELQAAATEDAIVISLGECHSFQLDEIAHYLHSNSARNVLVQALLDAPMFTIRWRWVASISLALPRFRSGKKIAPQLQRMQAEDLLSVVFPDQLACAENVAGEREVPDQPLVTQTIRDCLEDAMDVAGLLRVLKGIERGDIRVVSRDLTEPSPLSQEILNAKPYAFLDDAPLEERRTQAVVSRRWLDPQTAAELGILDQEAINRVRDEAWPDVSDADELHDALMSLGFVTESEGSYNIVSFSASGSDSNPSTLYPNDRPRKSARNGWAWHLDQLLDERRATVLHTRSNGPVLWVAVERLPMVKAVFPGSSITPECTVPNEYSNTTWSRETATIELIRARLQGLGPVAALALAHSVGLPVGEIEAALTALETDGSVLRGSFTPGGHTTEWCERALLARIHRYTVNRLRRDIQPVPAADFMRFLFVWHRMTPNERLEGQQALSALIEQLEGVQAPANAWEEQILPARINAYEPHWLDALCLSGRVTWERLNPPRARETGERSTTPLRSTPIALLLRKNLSDWHDLAPPAISSNCALSAGAKRVSNALATNGASFFDDLLSQTGLLRTQAEKALAELVASGRVTADSFNGLRALIGPSNQRRARIGYRRMRKLAPLSLENAGRWVSLKRDQCDSKRTAESPSWLHTERQIEAVESIALILLRRYGIVFRQLLRRETLLPSWRDLLTVYRRLEARGEIRGGRFVAGFSGEQFALPEAVGKLRAVRKSESSGQLVALSGADPLNLSGIITPGPLVPALTANRVLYRDGVAIATHARGRVEFLSAPEPGAEWATKQALLRGCNSATPHAYFK